MRGRFTALAMAAVVASGCGTTQPTVAEKDGLHLVTGRESRDGMGAEVRGEVTVLGSCIGLIEGGQSWTVVWPAGTTFSDDDAALIELPDGRALAEGDRFDGGGGYLHVGDVGVPELPGDCPADEIAVLNSHQEI